MSNGDNFQLDGRTVLPMALAGRSSTTPPTIRVLDSRSASDLEAKSLPPLNWVIEGFLPEGLCVLAGKPKVGKSWLALSICAAVANGTPLFDHMPSRPGLAFYMALEDGERRVKNRLKMIEGGFSSNLHYAIAGDFHQMNTEGINELDDWLRRHPTCKLVVIDTLGRVRPSRRKNANDYDEDTTLGGKLQAIALKHHICLLLVHHSRKAPSTDYMDEVLGSTGISGTADVVAVLTRDRGQGGAILQVTGRDLPKELRLSLKFDGDNRLWELPGGIEGGDPVIASQERKAILAVLADKGVPLGPTAVAAILCKKTNNIKQLMYKMSLSKELYCKDGKYELPVYKK